jgi:tetratricopeptide (TPR) repeat protein
MSREARARRRDGWRATRLYHKAFRLRVQGRAAEAAPLAIKALGMARALAAADPGRYQGSLARALAVAADVMQETHRDDEAFQLVGEAVATYRAIPATKHPAYQARAAHQMAVGLARRGRWGEALPFDEEAVGIYRKLAAAGRDGNLAPTLGSVMTALVVHAYALGEGALQWSVELERRDPVLSTQLEQIAATLAANPAVFSSASKRFGGASALIGDPSLRAWRPERGSSATSG